MLQLAQLMESDDEGIADLKVEDFMNATGRRL